MGKRVLVILLLLTGVLTSYQVGKQKEETATSRQRNSNPPEVILQEKDFESLKKMLPSEDNSY